MISYTTFLSAFSPCRNSFRVNLDLINNRAHRGVHAHPNFNSKSNNQSSLVNLVPWQWTPAQSDNATKFYLIISRPAAKSGVFLLLDSGQPALLFTSSPTGFVTRTGLNNGCQKWFDSERRRGLINLRIRSDQITTDRHGKFLSDPPSY